MKIRGIGLILMVLGTSLSAQTTVFEFNGTSRDTSIYDFGRVKESLETLEFILIVKNTGEKNGKLLSVEPSCDCITSKSLVNKEFKPGEVDTVIFNVAINNRPGALNKTIKIKTDGQPKGFTQVIKGYVLPVFESVEEQYPYKSGDLWFELRNKFISTGNINDGDTVKQRITFYNASKDSIKLNYTQKEDSALVIAFQKRVIAPKAVSYFDLTYYPKKGGDYGHIKVPITFFTDEKLYPRKELFFHAYVLPQLNNEGKAMPQVKIDTNIVDFGVVADSVSLDKQLTIANNGNAPLAIKQVKSNCSCVKVSTLNNELSPGQKTSLNIILDPRKRLGAIEKFISVFTDDPVNPVLVIDVKATIKNSDK